MELSGIRYKNLQFTTETNKLKERIQVLEGQSSSVDDRHKALLQTIMGHQDAERQRNAEMLKLRAENQRLAGEAERLGREAQFSRQDAEKSAQLAQQLSSNITRVRKEHDTMLAHKDIEINKVAEELRFVTARLLDVEKNYQEQMQYNERLQRELTETLLSNQASSRQVAVENEPELVISDSPRKGPSRRDLVSQSKDLNTAALEEARQFLQREVEESEAKLTKFERENHELNKKINEIEKYKLVLLEENQNYFNQIAELNKYVDRAHQLEAALHQKEVQVSALQQQLAGASQSEGKGREFSQILSMLKVYDIKDETQAVDLINGFIQTDQFLRASSVDAQKIGEVLAELKALQQDNHGLKSEKAALAGNAELLKQAFLQKEQECQELSSIVNSRQGGDKELEVLRASL